MQLHHLLHSNAGRRLACAAFALALLSSASASVTWKEIQFGGFASQGFIQSDTNDYLGETSDGTFDFREFGVNASWSSGKWRIGAQVFGQRLGSFGHDTVKLDWASVDYQAAQWLGFRAGRVKMPRGLYNEALDLDSVRPFILLPQSIYDARLRDFNAAFDGGMLYGNISLKQFGSVDYRAFYGRKEIDTNSGANAYFNNDFAMLNGPIGLDAVYGGSVFWNTPLNGLRFGYSYSEFKNLEATRWFLDDTTMGPVWKRTSMFPRHLVSAEYTTGDWVFAAEATQEDATYKTGFFDLPDWPISLIDAKHHSYYVSAARRINARFELGTYYSYFKKTDQLPPTFDYLRKQEDIAVSVRFDVNEHLILKAEIHRLKGNGQVFEAPRDVFAEPPPRDDGAWTMFAVKATLSF